MLKQTVPNVAIVGAGPGSPDLITVRGLRRVQNAEVVIYDRLVSPKLLQEAKVDAKKINVGKAPHRKRFPQERINQILVQESLSGKRVVRLKGGDPFVFGLGSSETISLVQAGIVFEIVPGVSASTALTGLVGIPLTMKNQVTSFTVLSGHYPPGHALAADFDNLPRNSMLIILMGKRHLASIVNRLIKNHWMPDTPVALIASGATAHEQVVITTLSKSEIDSQELTSPLTIAIGDGVHLHAKTSPYLFKSETTSVESVWGISREVEK